MNYILYNPKSNNENNYFNIIHGAAKLEELGVKKICLIGLDIIGFCNELCDSDRVLICGGDGTLNHFANDTYGFEFPCPVFVIRSGTGNDFLNDLGQMDNENLIDIREHLKNLPEIEVNGERRRFINGVGLGIDGRVCVEVEKTKARTDKKVHYTPIAVKLLAYEYKRPNAKLTVDGVTHEYTQVWTAATMKGKYFGGGMKVAPMQDRTNGKISVMMMHGGSRLKTLGVFTKIFKGTHVKHTEMIDIYEGYDIEVEFDTPSDVQIDGETIVGVTKYSVHLDRPEICKGTEESKEEALV